MTQREETGLATGLPARFAGDQGFARLCDLLAINRDKRQRLAARIKRASPALRNPKNSTTKVRNQFYITHFYAQPHERRRLWEETLPVVNEPRRMPPSLECCALAAYDPECLTRTVSEQELAEALAALPDVERPLANVPDSWRPALAVWPSIRRDVLDWGACSPERQCSVVAAVFAVATVLDDVRLLRWTADQADQLADEFAFAFESPQQATAAEDVDGSPAPASDVVQRWKAVCREAVTLATELGADPPQPQLLPELREAVQALDELHEALLAAQEANRSQQLVKRVAAMIAALADEHSAPWLENAVGQIHALWKLEYLSSDAKVADQLPGEIRRIESELPRVLREWGDSRQVVEGLEAQLSTLPEQPSADLASLLSAESQRTELETATAHGRARKQDCMLRVLDGATPEDREFDPSRDYESEWSQGDTGGGDGRAAERGGDAASRTRQNTGRGPQASTSAEVVAPEALSAGSEAGLTAAGPQGDADPTSSERRSPGADANSHASEGSQESARAPDSAVVDPAACAPDEAMERTNGGEPYSAAPTRRPPAQSNGVTPSFGDALDALWNSVSRRPGIAYHIARLLREKDCADPALPPPALVAATILSDHVRSADDKTADALTAHLGQLDPDRLSGPGPHVQDSLHLLLFSATILPALIVPATGAPSLLRRVNLPDSLRPLCDLAVAVAEHAERLQHVRLDVSLFGQFEWSEQVESVRARTRDWLRKAKDQRILYGPAHRVWMNWLGEAGCLGKLAAVILHADPGGKREIEDILEQLAAKKSFDNLVEETDRRIRPQKRGSIEGRARPQLEQHVGPLIDLASQWLRLLDAAPDSRPNFVDRNLKSLRRIVVDLGGRANHAIDGIVGSAVPRPFSSALTRARKTVEALRRLFEDHDPIGLRSEDPDALLMNDLLYVTGVDVGVDGPPVATPGGADTLAMLADFGAHVETLRAAHQARLDRGDLYGARLAYHLMEKTGGAYGTESDLGQCLALLERAERKRRIELLGALAELQDQLEQIFCFGQLSEEEAASLRADLVQAEGQLQSERTDAIGAAEVRITGIRRSLSEYTDKGTAEARGKFESLPFDCDPDARLRVERAIEQGDLLTANELMSRIEAGEHLHSDSPERRDPFREFMSVVEGIERRLANGNGLEAFIKAAEKRQAVDGVHFEAMSEPEVEPAAQLIRTWEELSRRKLFLKKTVDALLTSLGLPVRRMSSEHTGRNWASAMVETDLVQDRSRCPLPQFGSAARGRYRVLLDWGRTARESIPQVMTGAQVAATILLHFEPLGADRDWLRRWAIDEHRVFLTIDPALVVFLASRGSERLPSLFYCALPFTDVDPYVTTSGLVPPELFFGRAHERQRIADPFGPCFIYGGRQLGKTALLRSVERDFHRPDKQQVAKWIDLKAREIGHARKAAEIWPLLWRELCQLDVVKRAQLPQEPNPDNADHIRKLIDAVGDWVAERRNRRLLLLLDEADDFLEADARTDFRESTRLKGLMDRTDRRLKVVFAGLHNVLRTTERANHPLAHFGVPINVGPLLANGEWMQAQQLVREPLRAVGYGFATGDLSTLILAQTNYYPSLIQLYGAELVRRLRDSKKSVPYDIQATDITEVYRSKALGSVIRERFLLTLQLDQRYEVIAYALAFELQQNAQQLRRGLERRQIWDRATGWWSEGFGDDMREFDVLLQEMEGLGVLRSTEEGQCYTLRNPNILLLLGNGEEIAQALERPREAPKQFEPSVFHAQQRDADNGARHRCPLTYEQEAMLRARGGVAVVSGCDAAGIGTVVDFLSQRIEKQSFQRLPDSTDAVEFRLNLMKLQPRSVNVVSVVLVPQEAAWDAEWLEVATTALRKKKTGRLLRVVFVAHPERLWQVMVGLEASPTDPEWIGIGPWDEVFVRQWLEDNTLPNDRDRARSLMAISGGWSMVLDRFVRRSSGRLAWDEKIGRLRQELTKDGEWLLRLGVTPTVGSELRTLLRHQPLGPEDIASVAHLEGADPAGLRRRAVWCQRLGLLTRGEDQWRFNSLVERLLGDGSG